MQFTFYYIYIKTNLNQVSNDTILNLHSTIFILKLLKNNRRRFLNIHLHSTIFILKLGTKLGCFRLFHNLHSTIFILKQRFR